jgi:hypothetical protein
LTWATTTSAGECTADRIVGSWQLGIVERRRSGDEVILTATGGERAARRRGACGGFGLFRKRMALQ